MTLEFLLMLEHTRQQEHQYHLSKALDTAQRKLRHLSQKLTFLSPRRSRMRSTEVKCKSSRSSAATLSSNRPPNTDSNIHCAIFPPTFSLQKATCEMDGTGEKKRSKNSVPVSCIFVHAGAGYHSIANEKVHLKACDE